MVTIRRLLEGRHLFQCGYQKVRRLSEARDLLEEIQYVLFEQSNLKRTHVFTLFM